MKRHLLLAALLFAVSAQAERVSNLYNAVVPIADHSREQRQLALRQGLADVLVKLTGASQVLEQPGVQDALSQPGSYMVEFGYTSLPPVKQADDGDDPAEDELAVSLRFSEAALERLLRANQLPVWPANRPSVLVWLVEDVPNEGPRILDAEQDPEAINSLYRAMGRRGVPGRLPLLDLQDQLTVSPEQAWALDKESLSASAQRYRADSWLVIRGYESFDGSWRGSWMLANADADAAALRDNAKLDSVSADSLAGLISSSFDAAVDQLSPAFTYVAMADSNQVTLTVEQVKSYADYNALIDVLSALEMVLQVHVDLVDGDLLKLRLETEGDVQILSEALQRDRRFTPVTDLNDYQRSLHMAWSPE